MADLVRGDFFCAGIVPLMIMASIANRLDETELFSTQQNS